MNLGQIKNLAQNQGSNKVLLLASVFLVIMILFIAIGVGSAFWGLMQYGEAAPNTLKDGSCNIDPQFLPIFEKAAKDVANKPEKINTPVALIAAIYYAGEHGHSWGSPSGNCSSKSKCSSGNSCDNNWCTSASGAKGPFQFMDDTWAKYGKGGNKFDIDDAAKGAARYLGSNIETQHGTNEEKIRKAIYLYNHSDTYVNRVFDQYVKFTNCQSVSASSSNKVAEIAANEMEKKLSETQYATKYGGKATDPWCAYFASWVYKEAGFKDKDGKSFKSIGSTAALKQYFADNGSQIKAASVKPGDLLYEEGHVMIATSPSANGKTTKIIAGNETGNEKRDKIISRDQDLSKVEIYRWHSM